MLRRQKLAYTIPSFVAQEESRMRSNVKRIRRMKVFTALVLLVVMSSTMGCSSVPVGTEETEDPAQYLQVNRYVERELNEGFYEVFPAEIQKEAVCQRYAYRYECAIGGMPSYYLHLRLQMNTVDFTQEAERLEQMDAVTRCWDGDTCYVVFGGEKGDFQRYLDEVIEDGRCFSFRIAVIDRASGTIEYFYAQLYDEFEADAEVKELLLRAREEADNA